jgi:hypothetical protein
MNYRRTYRAAAVSFADLVSRVPAQSWAGPGLGDWTLRELVGHTVSSGLRQVPAVLGTPAGTVSAESPEAFWAFARGVPPDFYAKAVAASSEDAGATGEALGADPVGMVNDMAGRATAALSAAADDDVVATPVGGMRVRDWLPTRTFELVVHGLDAAGAAGLTFDPGADAMTEATLQAARVALALGDGPAVLRALTGRAGLPDPFSIV